MRNLGRACLELSLSIASKNYLPDGRNGTTKGSELMYAASH
jgi:hypothetical protein